MNQYDAVYQVSTVNVGASGSTGIETFTPVKSNSIFERLCVTCVPLGSFSTYKYSLIVYIDGEVEETKNFSESTDRKICHMSFPNKLFPPNVGVNSVPAFFGANGFDPGLAGFTIAVQSYESELRTFLFYATYIEYNTPRFSLLGRN